MNAKRIDELDALARDFINGVVNRNAILSLPMFDQWYVLTMAGAFSCTKVGTMAQKECVKMKYRVGLEYRQFVTMHAYYLWSHKEWCERTRRYSGKLCEVYKELKKEEPDAVRFFDLLCEALDLLTKDDVLHRLFMMRINDADFKKNCHDAVRKHADEWLTRFEHIADEDYVSLLDKFYEATDENRLAEIYGAVKDDSLKANAYRGIPIKKEYTRDIADGYRLFYERK